MKHLACLLALLVGVCACAGTADRPAPAASSVAAPAATAAPSATPDYHPVIDPATFTDKITNPYFPLKPGTTLVFEGTRDGRPQHAELTVTAETRVIMGVTCVVVRDIVTVDNSLHEKTTDWYAQAANGDVWYFGEATAEYANGKISSTKGSWEAGVDGAQPGIIMMAAPKVGESYRQEFRPGIAEDMARITQLSKSLSTPAGKAYKDVVVTDDTNPLDPDKFDVKYYASGFGLVYTKRARTGHTEDLSLVKTVKA
ncbi:hypothetical protein J5X84_35615 [Streptosporangiaceae bacterium NEAU-GS5]|nr:hypothetical protein [Streptosporangiaceae bacterium NEAU-GS5]